MKYTFIDHVFDHDYQSECAQSALRELDSQIDQHITDADYPPVAFAVGCSECVTGCESCDPVIAEIASGVRYE